MAQRTLYIIYNADGTLLGKLRYGYRKLSSSSAPESPCAACDITHGGLSLKEAPGWVDAKKEIEGGGVSVVQWHRDEVNEKVKDYVKVKGERYPVVLFDAGEGLSTVMTSGELNACAGRPSALVAELRKKGALGGRASL